MNDIHPVHNNNNFRAWVASLSVSNLMFTCKDDPVHNLSYNNNIEFTLFILIIRIQSNSNLSKSSVQIYSEH